MPGDYDIATVNKTRIKNMFDKMPGTQTGIFSFQSATLAAVTDQGVQFECTAFLPAYWLIVVRLTAGFILAYPGPGRAQLSFKLDAGIMQLPFPNPLFTVESVGATGFYSLYAVENPGLFNIQD